MPIYAYRCAACGHAADMLRKLSDPPLTLCPACGAAAFEKQVTAAGFQLKGSGWYVTDFRDGSGKKPEKSVDKGADKGADKPADKSATDAASPGKNDNKSDNKATPTASPAPAPAAPAATAAPTAAPPAGPSSS